MSKAHTVKARNNALGGNVSKHPKIGRDFGPGRYLEPGCNLGPMDEFCHGYQHSMFTPKNTCTCMHTVQDVRSCELPRAYTRMWATTRVKCIDMLYLGAYTEGGRYFRWALFQMGVISDGRYYGLLRH